MIARRFGRPNVFADIVLSRHYRGLDHNADRDCLCSTFKFSLKSVES